MTSALGRYRVDDMVTEGGARAGLVFVNFQ